MDFVFTVRRIKSGKFEGEPGPVRFLKVPKSPKTPLPDHQVKKKDWVDAIMAECQPGAENNLTEGDIVLLVHGFNVDAKEMLALHRKVRAGLERNGFKGVVVSFDWPAEGSTLAYLEDRKDAKETALSLVDEGIKTFVRLQRDDCKVDVHVMAHSMGAYVTREAFDDADDRASVAARSWSVSQVLLVAADISDSSLADGSSKSSSLFRHAVRVTNYYSPLDDVLSISATKRLGVARRAGRVGSAEPLHEKMANIYCGDYFKKNRDQYPVKANTSHAWYFEDDVFYKDAALTISGALDREELPTRGRTDRGNLALVKDG